MAGGIGGLPSFGPRGTYRGGAVERRCVRWTGPLLAHAPLGALALCSASAFASTPHSADSRFTARFRLGAPTAPILRSWRRIHAGFRARAGDPGGPRTGATAGAAGDAWRGWAHCCRADRLG